MDNRQDADQWHRTGAARTDYERWRRVVVQSVGNQVFMAFWRMDDTFFQMPASVLGTAHSSDNAVYQACGCVTPL
jgi:hypothetical protein